MNREDLTIVFNKICKNEIDETRKKTIIDKIMIYGNYVELGSISLLCVIESFININKLGFIDKIDDNLFVLLKNILGKKNNKKITEEEGIYLLDYLNYLVIPYNILKCEKDYDLPKFLGEFEIMVSYIEDDDSFLDMEKLKSYNEVLYNLIKFRIEWYMKNINNEVLRNGNVQDQLIIETTLSHLMTIFYFSLDKYNGDYTILGNSYDIIVNNCMRLKDYCKKNNLYNDMFLSGFIVNNHILKEYEFCKHILDGLMEKNKMKVKK